MHVVIMVAHWWETVREAGTLVSNMPMLVQLIVGSSVKWLEMDMTLTLLLRNKIRRLNCWIWPGNMRVIQDCRRLKCSVALRQECQQTVIKTMGQRLGDYENMWDSYICSGHERTALSLMPDIAWQWKPSLHDKYVKVPPVHVYPQRSAPVARMQHFPIRNVNLWYFYLAYSLHTIQCLWG